MVKQAVADRACLHPWRDHKRRYAHPIAREGVGVVVGRVLRRCDVVEEPAVLVVEDEQERLVPLRAGGEGVVDEQCELLPVSHRRVGGHHLGETR
jgi:hypothetical protein